MEVHIYRIELDKNGNVTKCEDCDSSNTSPSIGTENKLFKIEYYRGEFEGVDIHDALDKARDVYKNNVGEIKQNRGYIPTNKSPSLA